jgi:Ca2+:H+ antiporter
MSAPSLPRWTIIAPLVGVLLLPIGFLVGHGVVHGLLGLVLMAVVLAAVHHAEVVAHRIGEPLGTLVLALAVTVIEAALIISMMLGGGPEAGSLARDSIYAAVMIICNCVIGVCLLVGGAYHREQSFRIDGTHAGFAILIALAGLALVLPSFTTSTPGPSYSVSQLIFAGLASLCLWGVFVFGQTVRHREYFQNPTGGDAPDHGPNARQAWLSAGLLLTALVGVVGLAKAVSPSLSSGLAAIGAPPSVLGICIALLVLLPETLAAVYAARANRLQTSMNLAIGSALATIGLTIPVVVACALILDLPLSLGLPPKDLVLLGITFLVGSMTLARGRTTVMDGAVHLVLFAAFLFLAFVP